MSEISPAAEDGCVICDLVSGTAGTTVFENELWMAGVLPGLEVPGWIVLAQRRHSYGAAEMSDREAAELGPLLKRLSTAIESLTDAERVYVSAYGENAPHWHLLLNPRGPDVPAEQRHAAMWSHRHEYLDPEQAGPVAAELRDLLADSATESVSPG